MFNDSKRLQDSYDEIEHCINLDSLRPNQPQHSTTKYLRGISWSVYFEKIPFQNLEHSSDENEGLDLHKFRLSTVIEAGIHESLHSNCFVKATAILNISPNCTTPRYNKTRQDNGFETGFETSFEPGITSDFANFYPEEAGYSKRLDFKFSKESNKKGFEKLMSWEQLQEYTNEENMINFKIKILVSLPRKSDNWIDFYPTIGVCEQTEAHCLLMLLFFDVEFKQHVRGINTAAASVNSNCLKRIAEIQDLFSRLENKHSGGDEERLDGEEDDGNNAEKENLGENVRNLETRNQIIKNLTTFLQNITLKTILDELEAIESPYHNFTGHIKSIIQNKLGEIIDKRIESFTSLDLPLHSKLQESLKIYQSPVPISNCLNTVHPGIPKFQLFKDTTCCLKLEDIPNIFVLNFKNRAFSMKNKRQNFQNYENCDFSQFLKIKENSPNYKLIAVISKTESKTSRKRKTVSQNQKNHANEHVLYLENPCQSDSWIKFENGMCGRCEIREVFEGNFGGYSDSCIWAQADRFAVTLVYKRTGGARSPIRSADTSPLNTPPREVSVNPNLPKSPSFGSSSFNRSSFTTTPSKIFKRLGI